MKRISLSVIAAALITGPAFAADIPIKSVPRYVEPVYNWGGWYIGAGVGFRGAKIDDRVTNETLNGVGVGPFNPVPGCGFISGGCPFGEPIDQVAFRGTFYGGYNWQWSQRWVLGIEGDVGLASRTRRLVGMDYPVEGFTTLPGIGMLGNAGDSFAVKTSWDASIRGRIGWLYNPSVLLYITGGASWLHLETTSTCTTALSGGGAAFLNGCVPGTVPAFSPAVITDKTTRLGGTIGFGLEAMLGPNWIARGEYRYSGYGTASFVDNRTVTVAGTSGGTTFTVGQVLAVSHQLQVNTHTATFGISYLFGGPAAVSTRY
jgi:outer membrane immunogenic protein